MWQFVKDNPTLAIFTVSTVGALVAGVVHHYWMLHQHDKDIEAIKIQHCKDISDIRHDHDRDVCTLRDEIDEIKDSYMQDVKEILQKLNTLSDAVSKIQGFIEGQQAR